MKDYLLIMGMTIFLLWYDRCLFTDILAIFMSALVAMLSALCFLAILVMLPINFCGRILGYNTSSWTGSVVAAIMKPIQIKGDQGPKRS